MNLAGHCRCRPKEEQEKRVKVSIVPFSGRASRWDMCWSSRTSVHKPYSADLHRSREWQASVRFAIRHMKPKLESCPMKIWRNQRLSSPHRLDGTEAIPRKYVLFKQSILSSIWGKLVYMMKNKRSFASCNCEKYSLEWQINQLEQNKSLNYLYFHSHSLLWWHSAKHISINILYHKRFMLDFRVRFSNTKWMQLYAYNWVSFFRLHRLQVMWIQRMLSELCRTKSRKFTNSNSFAASLRYNATFTFLFVIYHKIALTFKKGECSDTQQLNIWEMCVDIGTKREKRSQFPYNSFNPWLGWGQ